MLSTRPVPMTIWRLEKEKLWALLAWSLCGLVGTGRGNTSARIRLSLLSVAVINTMTKATHVRKNGFISSYSLQEPGCRTTPETKLLTGLFFWAVSYLSHTSQNYLPRRSIVHSVYSELSPPTSIKKMP